MPTSWSSCWSRIGFWPSMGDCRRHRVTSYEIMVSFDVVPLFTYIPTGLAVSTVDELLQEKYEEDDQQLKRKHVTELLELRLKIEFTSKIMEYRWAPPCLG
ncbi:unnamed protein product [Dibothriocephalus latus]|uniref:Uncharacterized protein n=1 Tax=Dibothriocephalus latus TaxID=60516 RepID=A0A3P7RFW7_DIBLA|nr:unnamed protein product [Dibothriocephalus latus]